MVQTKWILEGRLQLMTAEHTVKTIAKAANTLPILTTIVIARQVEQGGCRTRMEMLLLLGTFATSWVSGYLSILELIFSEG